MYEICLLCLSDTVKAGIKKLDFVEAYYEKAFEILDKKYNNKKVTVDNHISEIVTMKSMNSETSAELNRIMDTVSANVDAFSLESIEMAVDVKRKPTCQEKPLKSFLVVNENFDDAACEIEHLNLKERWRFVKAKGLCFNCLGHNHILKNCPHKSQCFKCSRKIKKKHHPLLHNDCKKAKEMIVKEETKGEQVALVTALVNVYDAHNRPHQARVLLDSGSESNLMTDKLTRKLNIPRTSVKSNLKGVMNSNVNGFGKVGVSVGSKCQDFVKKLDFVIVDEIADKLPAEEYCVKDWKIPKLIPLADPEFNKPGEIDMILGAEVFMDLLLNHKIKLGSDLPWIQKTKFGWALAGRIVAKERIFHRADNV